MNYQFPFCLVANKLNYFYDIKVYKQYLDNLFHGLNYLGIEKILKQLVEESNEKI